MRCSLNELFLLSSSNNIYSGSSAEDIFGLSINNTETLSSYRYKKEDIDLCHAYFSRGFNISVFNESARNLLELSAEAFDTFIHAWMSELPIDAEITAFYRKVIAAAQECKPRSQEEKCKAAARAASDRGDQNTLTVLNAAYKVQREIHRMMGLLRFTPDDKGVYIARFEPDHFIIPALGDYFTERFGQTAWAVIDEKRGLCLRCMQGKQALTFHEAGADDRKERDEWEELWKHYHSTINNESRKNTNLQRQLMPKRYWKYLNEV